MNYEELMQNDLERYYEEERAFYEEWGYAISEDEFVELCDTLVPDNEDFIDSALNDPEIACYDTESDTGAISRVWVKRDKLQELAEKF